MPTPAYLRTAVLLDLAMANQLLAACEQRLATLRLHVENGIRSDEVESAIVDTLAAELTLRQTFDLPATYDPEEGSFDPIADATWDAAWSAVAAHGSYDAPGAELPDILLAAPFVDPGDHHAFPLGVGR